MLDVVATFDVTANRALVWASSGSPARAELWVEGDCLLRRRAPIEATTGSFATGYAVIDGLEPSAHYRARVQWPGDRLGAPFQFRTAPLGDADVRFAVGADIGAGYLASSQVLAQLASADLDFYVNLGDWPYADASPAARTLPEYRDKHWQVRSPPSVQALLRSCGVCAIYDDHDVECNWDEDTRLRQPERVAAALQAWDEYFPSIAPNRYRSWRWGRHLECFLLDTRAYRSSNDSPDDEGKTMLGAEQKSWLFESLRQSNATFKVILSSVPLDFCVAIDNWQVFTAERDELLDVVRSVPGAVFISADRHYFAAHDLGDGLREFHVGPVAAGMGRPPPVIPQVLASAHQPNFGLIEVASGMAPELRFSAIGGSGDVLYETRIYMP